MDFKEHVESGRNFRVVTGNDLKTPQAINLHNNYEIIRNAGISVYILILLCVTVCSYHSLRGGNSEYRSMIQREMM